MDTLGLGDLILISLPLVVIIFHLLFPKSKKQSRSWLWGTGIVESLVGSLALWLSLEGVEQIPDSEGVGKALAGGYGFMLFAFNFIVIWALAGYRLIFIPKVASKNNVTLPPESGN